MDQNLIQKVDPFFHIGSDGSISAGARDVVKFSTLGLAQTSDTGTYLLRARRAFLLNWSRGAFRAAVERTEEPSVTGDVSAAPPDQQYTTAGDTVEVKNTNHKVLCQSKVGMGNNVKYRE